jgi:hypothetical protein
LARVDMTEEERDEGSKLRFRTRSFIRRRLPDLVTNERSHDSTAAE